MVIIRNWACFEVQLTPMGSDFGLPKSLGT